MRLYQGDHDEEYVVKFGGTAPLYVGHVAIVEGSGSEAFVIEALGNRGVVRHPYKTWLAERKGQVFWHGRINSGTDADRSSIARIAAQHVGKPYDFWNFDLADEAGFYCSKLAWLSIYKALDIAADNRPTAKRLFWFSPKQLMKSPHVKLLLNPGSYTSH